MINSQCLCPVLKGVGAGKVNEEAFSWNGRNSLGGLGDVCSLGLCSGAMFADLGSVGEVPSFFLGGFA